MVAIVSGNNLGLSLGSFAALGSAGVYGGAANGRNGELAYVNAATGNLVLRDQDDMLVAHGLDVATVRTYNSLGKLNDDNADNWSVGIYAQQLRLTGTRNTAGSTLIRTDRDGAEATYTYDVTRALYVSTAGSGAYDTIVYDTPTSQYVWTDGDTGAQERYDSAATGRLLSSRDALGNTLTYAYNAAGLLSSVGDASGETTYYDYTGNNLTQVRTVYLNGSTATTLTRVRYAYDASNRLSSVTIDLTPGDNSVADGKVYTTSYTYDGTSRRVAGINQSDGTSLAFTYVQVGTDWRVATVKDALNDVTTFSYDTVARRTTVTDPLLLKTLFDYDASGQLLKVTAPPVSGVSQATSFVYNANGDLARTVDGEGRTVDMTYDANGNQTLQRDSLGNTVTRTFDARNQLLTETAYATPDPDGAGAALPGVPQTTRYVYDAGGKNLLRFVMTAEGRVTEYVYNAYGERTSAIQYGSAAYAVSTLGATAVPTEAQMTAWVATQDRTRSSRSDMAYDARGQLQKTTTYGSVDAAGNGVADANRSITQFVYDQAGLLLKTISPGNGATLYTYDGLGRQLSATDALNQTTLTQYDDANAKTLVTLASGLITTSTFDRASRLVSVLQSSASASNLGETRYFYDADSRLRMTQDPTGVRRWMLYDDAGHKAADIDATGTLTEYSYDKSDRLTRTVVYATAVNTSALVDAGGLPTNVQLATIRPAANAADQKAWRAYDGAGRLAKTVDAGGAVVETRYDGASRVVQTTAYATLIATAALSAAPTAASIAPAANGADRTSRQLYDNDGRLVGTLDGEGYLSENQYDAAGRLSVVIRYATVTAAAQQAAGTLAQLRPAAAAGDRRQVFLYNAKGQVAGMVDAENFLTEKVYDVDGNLTKVVRYATAVAAGTLPTATLAGIRPAAKAEDQVTTWAYDLLGRVSQQTNAEGTLTLFAYDSVGHLVTTTTAYGQPEARAINARFDIQGRLVGELTGEGGAQLTGSLTQAQIDAVWLQYGVAYTYDAAGRRLSATDQIGNKTLYYYDADGRLTHTINALGEVSERQYNAIGQLAATVDYGTRISLAGLTGGLVTAALTTAINAVKNATLDSRQSFTYNVTGTLASSTDALGNVTSDAYDAFGDLTSQTSPLGSGVTRTDTATYDHRGEKTASASDSAGINAATSATYDAFGRLVRSVDSNGNVTQQSFDRLGRAVQTIDASSAQRSSTYDAFDRVLTQTDATGQVTLYAYSTSARSVTVTTPEGVAVTTVHTRFDQTQSIKDGKGQPTSYTYDRDGNLLTTVTPLTTTKQSYDKADRLFDTTDARGFKVAYAYDAANRVLTRSVDPTGLNLVTRYAYDAKGEQVSVTDPLGTVTTTSYDLKGQTLRQTVDPGGLNLQTTWTWDARGKALTVTSPTGAVTQYTYDKLGRRTKEQVDPAGLNITRSWTYDKNGNAVTATDANAKVSRYAYDALDRLVYSVDAAGDAVRTDYDAEGRVTRTTRYATPLVLTTLPTPATAAQIQALVVASPGKDAVDARRYDRDGRLRFTVDGTGAVTEFKYDANGNVVESIGYANVIALASWNGSTDPVVTADAARDRHVRTVYDALDRATYVADGVGMVVQNTYDLNGNVVKQTRYATAVTSATAPSAVVANANDRIAVFTFDAANRETWRADAFGAVTRSDYDADGNLLKSTRFANVIAAGGTPSSVVANAAADRATAYTYDKASRLTYTADALGYVTRNTYDNAGRVLTTTRFALSVAAGAAATTVVASANDRTDTFTYDLAGRLNTSTDAIGGKQSFSYDGLGNKLSFTNEKGSIWTYAYDAAGRMVSETTPQVALTTVTALSSGNLVENQTAMAAIVTQLSYDGLGNLLSRTEAAGRTGEQRTTSYAYDAAGRQIKVTYPPLAVYTETTAALATNGATSLAARTEATAVALSTFTYYDGLGDAVANVDVAGSPSFKTYDAMGRVSYEVDALGYVTNYVRNAFGESTAVTRYANVTGLAATVPTSAAQAPTAAQISAVVNATGVNHASDRVLTNVYDKLGRISSVTEPQSFTYDADTALGTTAGKQTKNTFDAFGELIQVAVSKTTSTWLNTYNYFDKVGNQIASVDALGYLTTHAFDAVGNNVSTTEFAKALTAGSWNATTYAAGTVDTKDRKTDYVFDLLDRKVSETRRSVDFVNPVTGVSAAGDVTTTYGYDAVGNLTRTTDATLASVYSYYDALGRVTAVTAPTRKSTVAGTDLAPLTIFKRDAYGNAVMTIERANGAVAPAEFALVSTLATPGYTSAAADPADRTTVSKFDLYGHATQTTDAAANNHYFSYNARGQLAKSWQAVADNGGAVTTLFEAYQYDAIGQLTHTDDPAPSGSSGVTDTALEYNGFGELVRKGVNGKRQDYFDYDGAGRLWRTNNGDGVAKVFLYDLLGRQTSSIQSAGGADDRDLGLLASADQANILTNTRRNDTFYDSLGRIVKQVQAQRADAEGGLRVVRQLNTSAVVSSATGTNESGLETWSGPNRVDLSWSSLSGLGSGDIRVDLFYTTAAMVLVPAQHDESGNVTVPAVMSPGIAASRSQVFTAESAAAGASIVWNDPDGTARGGVSAVNRLVVYKKDVKGVWQKVTDQTAFGYAGNTIEVTAPADPATLAVLQVRPAGSTGSYTSYSLVNFGSALRYDASALAPGSYEYVVQTTVTGQGMRTASSGTLALNEPPLTAIGIPITYGGAGAGILAWQTQGTAMVQTLHYRASGTTGAWSTLTVANRNAGYDGVDTSGLAAGNYDFELLWKRANETAVYAHAIGTFSVTAAIAPVVVPTTVTPPDPANYFVGYTHAKYASPIVTGYDESGAAILAAHYAWSGNYVVAVPYTGTGIVRYDTVQTPVYGNVTVNPPNPVNYVTGSTRAVYSAPVFVGYDESGNPILGAHYAWSGSVVVGVSYTVSQIIRYDTVQVPVQVITGYDESGHPIYTTQYQTQQVPVYGNVTVNPANPANYMTQAPRTTYSAPVFVGYDESGAPILGAHYAWSGNVVVGVAYQESQIVGYTPTQVPVYGPVTITPPDPAPYLTTAPRPLYSAPVVLGYDESGVPQLGPHYAWSGNTIVAVPYASSYTIPGTPAQYASTVSTPANSIAVSGLAGALADLLAQTVTKASDTTMLRPTIVQTLDRWGNVLTVSDPRNAAWKTTYAYNASNQVVSASGADGSLTLTYYTALGQVASVKDARGNVNSRSYDSGGNLVKETHADGGIVTYAYSAFGDKLNTIDALGNAAGAPAQTRSDHTTSYTYDQLGHLLSTRHGVVNIYTSANLTAPTRTNVVEKYTYDAAGHKLSQTDGIDAHILKYKYDRAGNLIETLQPLGQTVRATFDALGDKLTQTDQDGSIDTWTYDDFSRVKTHKDIGGATTTYTRDLAGQLTRQTNDRTGVLKQDIAYSYDQAGQLTQEQDVVLSKVTTYAYDLAGHHVLERTVQGGVVYQDNHLGYDMMGQLRDVNDGRVHLSMTYDAAGNRTYVNTVVNLAVGTGASAADDIRTGSRYFQYDQMNRQIVVDAVDAAGNLGQQGHKIGYDVNGNRIQDEFYGNRVITTTGPTQFMGFDESTGVAIYAPGNTTYTKATGTVVEEYGYDAMDRLTSVLRDGVQVDHRLYDAASEVLLTGPNGTLPTAYAAKLNEGQAADAVIGDETRKNTYDNNRRLTHQTVLKSDNSPRNDIDYNSYDAAGNLLQYKLKNNDGTSYTNTYTSTITKYDGYRETFIAGSSDVFQSGTTTKAYDGNGFLTGVTDSTKGSNSRTFVNDASGVALLVSQSGTVERQLVVNGEVMGRYGVGIDEVTPRVNDGDPNFAKLANFNFGYQPINGNYPTASAGSYAVQSGDTLQSIAQGAYGDEKLWYRIADANGLSGNGDLRVGQTLTIPSRVGTVHNDSGSFKPYDPSKITGDTTPNLPSPSRNDCGGLGLILVIVVAVVVTVFTAGVAAAAIAPAATAATAGAGGIAGTFAVGGAALTGTFGAEIGIAAGAIGAAVGSVVSQGVGIAIGVQDTFSWKQVALSAIGGGVSGGFAGFAGGAGLLGNGFVRAAVSNAVTQGIGVATGLQDKFNWAGVAASAVGAQVGQTVGNAVGDSVAGLDLSDFTKRLVTGSASGIAAGFASAAMHGGRISIEQVSADAFGNALGSTLASAASSNGGQPQQEQSQADNRSLLNGAERAANPNYYSTAANVLAQELAKGGGVSDSATNAEIMAYQMREAGYDRALTPTEGSAADADLKRSRAVQLARMRSLLPPEASEPPTDGVGSDGTYRVEIRGTSADIPLTNAQNSALAKGMGPLNAQAAALWLAQSRSSGASDSAGSIGQVDVAIGGVELAAAGVYNQIVRIGGGLASIPYLLDSVDAAVAIQEAAQDSFAYRPRSGGAAAIGQALMPIGTFARQNIIDPVRSYSEATFGDGATTVVGATLEAGIEIIGTVGALKGGQAVLESALKRGLTLADVAALPVGQRPEPATYLSREYIENHLRQFNDGASYLTPKAALDRWGRETLGRADGQFVMPAKQLDDVLQKTGGDMALVEKELGIPAGTWQGREFVRIDIPDPRSLEVRLPSGNESGANPLWLPGGRLPTGYSEAVVNPIPRGAYSEWSLPEAVVRARK